MSPRRPPRLLVKATTAAARFAYRLSGGRIGGRIGGGSVLLLTTRGRRSGKSRTVPLLYIDDGADLVLVASFGGADAHPAWYLNLEADPDVEVQLHRQAPRPMCARTASPEERERLWPRVAAVYSGYDKYERRTSRQIPLVILTPRSGAG